MAKTWATHENASMIFLFKWAAPETETKAALIVVANVVVVVGILTVVFLEGPKIGLSIN